MGCTLSKKCNILILVGSARKHSANAGLVDEIQRFVIDQKLILKLIIPSL